MKGLLLNLSLLALCLLSMCGSAVGGYNQSEAIRYVWLSAAAYCSAESIRHWNCGRPCEEIPSMRDVKQIYNKDYDAQVYVGQFKTSSAAADTVISFRGTIPSSIQDWIDDLYFTEEAPYPYCSGCKVHSGFYDTYSALKPQIKEALNDLGVDSSTNIQITGHSLGAALAALCAFDLRHEGYTVHQVFTFGQPRVGNKEFAETFSSTVHQSTTYRVVHWADIVAQLPWQSTFGVPFHHVPTEVWYNANSSSYTVCNGSGEDPNCSDSLDLALSVSDHLHYINIPISGSCDPGSFSFNDAASFEILSAEAKKQLDRIGKSN
eukprot:gb/GECG01010831.1/.p1 GENE.gb/GECG01010831.1/~~gb/GECG01010831.1/.p1  ORF type:complete len:320 (+),score=30.57 gb/GECG01010831.1/:1-960(+)